MNLTLSRRDFLAALGAALLLPVLGTAAIASNTETYPYLLGDATIKIKVFHNGNGPTFVCPHDNENTASAVALEMVRLHGGVLIELSHNGERNIRFNHQGVAYTFDPNRMWTDRGIRASLQTLGQTYSEEAHQMVESFASVVKLFFKPGLIVAVHNNTDGNYALSSYTQGGDMENEASKIFINPDTDPDDFFFVTSTSLFDRLKARNFNVVLQARGASDDGSLSVYAASKGIPYVNVEAQTGHATFQRAMIEALF